VKEGDIYLISYTKLNVNVLSLIVAIIVFLTLGYTAQNINNWYSSIQKNMQMAEKAPANDVGAVSSPQENTAPKTSENTILEDSSFVILQSNEEMGNEASWQIEIPKFRSLCTNC